MILRMTVLEIVKTKINVHAETHSMEFGDNIIKLNIFDSMKDLMEEHSLRNRIT